MRILWLGNAPGVGSGYGEQASLFLPRIAELGHDLAVACNYGVQSMTINAGGLTIYPTDGAWGNKGLETYAEHHDAELVIALCDAWVLQPDLWPDGLEAAVWAPIDHYPVPPLVLKVLSDQRVRPIAMSRFGEAQLEAFGLGPLYVPHGVDTELFRPMPELRADYRAGLGIPDDAFLVGMVGANQGTAALPRKAFPQAFLAFSRFAREHPDAWLYVHTRSTPTAGGGIDLDLLTGAVGAPVDRVKFPDPKLFDLCAPPRVVAGIYQMFDALLMPSMGEGFGIPLIEAQACGVPVITSNHSAMTELCGAGWLVRGDPWWDALQESFFVVPAIDSIVEALEAAYEARDDVELRAAAVAFAAGYDADLVTDAYWRPALEALASPAPIREVGPLNGGRPKSRAGRPESVQA
jgi:glycosyltransferase involved in cell wall biosynthesis